MKNKIDASELLWITIISVLVSAVFWYAVKNNFYVYAIVWKSIKVFQMFFLYTFEHGLNYVISMIDYYGFSLKKLNLGYEYGFYKLLHTDYKRIDEHFVAIYDEFFNKKLRYIICPIFLYYSFKTLKARKSVTRIYTFESLIRNASKSYSHLRRIVPPKMIDKLLALIPLKAFDINREYLKGENPMDFDHNFNFNDRSSFENRYSMGLSQTEILTANPPIGVTQEEIESDKEFQKKYGYGSHFRPICYFYLDGKKEDHSIDFCDRTATISLERILVGKRTKADLLDSDKLGRCFDSEGKLIELSFVNDAEGKRIVDSGYRFSNLLNNGLEYKGTIDDVRLLFNSLERRVIEEIDLLVGKTSPVSVNKILYAIVTKKHAYSLTAIWRLIDLFKTKNKSRLTGTQLSWVKKEDRTLGFVLHSIGRETPFCEVSGVYSHYLLEVKYGSRLTDPFVLKAVQDLYSKAKAILEIGDKDENIFDMSDDEFDKKFKFDGEEITNIYSDILDDIEDM